MKDSNQNKQDCELFLRAFEKPTQIYRYLHMRRLLSPMFLQRNLSYLKGRITKRKNTNRKKRPEKFNWENPPKPLDPNKKNNDQNNFLVIKFLGYFDTNVSKLESATIDIHLLSQKKDQTNLLLKTIPVEINPSIITNPMSITISKEQLMRHASKINKSAILQIEVSYCEQQDENTKVRLSRLKKRKKNSYVSELHVFNKQGVCDLLEGEYELYLGDTNETVPVRKVDRLAWAADIPKVLAGDKRFFQNRSLKFFLQWNSDDATKTKSDSSTYSHTTLLASDDWCGVRTGSTTSLSTSSGVLSDMSSDDVEIAALTTKKLPNILPNMLSNRSPYVDLLNSHLIYRFIYNDDLSQKTEAWDGFLCPWCYLNCRSLHPLLMHLSLCHDRFKFSYTPKDDGIQIDVSINEQYNCALSPLKAKSLPFDQKKRPCKRKVYTKVLVSRPRARIRKSVQTFEQLDEDIVSDSSDAEENKFIEFKSPLVLDGHNREYYRTSNNMCYTHQADVDEDSEDEMDHGWLRKHTVKQLEEFIDVNEGEKAMLKMWNLHVMKHNIVGFGQLPLACEMFVTEHGDEIFAKNLYRNFLLHLTNLHDYGMLTPGEMFTITEQLQAKRSIAQ